MQYVPPIGGDPNDPYIDANPALGVEGSPVPAAAIEHPMREIMNVILAGGIDPDSGDLTQLLAAIQALIAASLTNGAAITGAFSNLKGSAPGTSAIVTYTIDELVTGDGAGNYMATRGWADTIDMTVSGAGGLDTGAVAASTWYYAFGITKPDGTQALLASLSASAPTLPAGYDKWARIGSFRTDATANKYPLAFKQSGSSISYNPTVGSNLTSYPVMASGNPGAFPISVGVSNFVPPTAERIRVSVKGSNVIGPSQYIKYGASSADSTVYFSGESATQGGNYWVTDESNLLGSSVFWGASSTGSGNLSCMGWKDSI